MWNKVFSCIKILLDKVEHSSNSLSLPALIHTRINYIRYQFSYNNQNLPILGIFRRLQIIGLQHFKQMHLILNSVLNWRMYKLFVLCLIRNKILIKLRSVFFLSQPLPNYNLTSTYLNSIKVWFDNEIGLHTTNH